MKQQVLLLSQIKVAYSELETLEQALIFRKYCQKLYEGR
ncbi:hypothetical protein JOC93_000588 [Priestia taiwanensis]|nr:hypothetical protein [Priestia taiwanensis]